MMKADLLDLGGFKELEQQLMVDTDTLQTTRTVFDHRLILITEVHKDSGGVKIRSNFQWERIGDKWRPNVSLANPNFKDPLG